MQACKPFAYIIKHKALSLGHKHACLFNVIKMKWTRMCWLHSEACLLQCPHYFAMVEMPLTPSGLDSLLGLSGL